MASLYVKLGAENRSGAVTDLRALIVEKLGNSPRADAQAALRELYSKNPAERDSIARALASHPTEESFPILVAALDSRDSNTTGLVLRGLGRLKAMPKGPDALAGLIRLARRSGPSMTGVLNRLASRWTGGKAPSDSNNFERTLAAWEAVYHKQFPSGPAIAALSAPGENAYSLPQLVENVLQSKIMKSASARPRPAAHRAGEVPRLPQVRHGRTGAGARLDDRAKPIPADRDPGVDRRAVEGDLGPVQGDYGRDCGRKGV